MQLPEIFLSLRQMSLCNIALQVFNDPDVRLFSSTHNIHCCIWSSEEIESLLGKEPSTMLNDAEVAKILSKRIKPNLSHKYKYLFTGNGKDFSLTSKQLEILVDQKLSTLSLPNMFRNEVMTFVRFVIVESYKWSQDHEELMVFTTDLTNSFQWTQDNKIDRQKTAKAIIADDNINLIDRFIMASHYCIQEDVLSIWGMLHHSQKNYIDVGTDIVRMWAKWARYGGEIDWDQIDEVPFTMFGFQPCFPKVKQEKRLQYLKDHYRVIWSNYHELKLFLSVLDQNDRNEILKKFPLQILEMFLDWSLQTKLLDVVELLWPYLSEYDVRDFLFLILSRKRMLNWIGSDYVTFVAKLQERFSYGYEVFKEMYPPLFNTLKLVHENDGPRPSPT
ncbi:uncharacterized protein TNCT_204731 [Trichonephila clavata]|uniref:Uncharacterized protein n=1 Tax=Trichonephila clavata TaxID=2740835 RepID=A0A8X6IFC4_TRICU|nr:uncharacterized protein TNCT_204731 [Trichonephila clavata]